MPIPRDDGRALLLEGLALISVLTVLALALGLAVGVPLAMMLNDLCSSINC